MDGDDRKGSRRATLDPTEAAKAERRKIRQGGGLVGYLRGFEGMWIYIEGVRLNYRGRLVGVLSYADGDPAGILLHPAFRVGDWNENGPTASHEEEWPTSDKLPRLIPWASVGDFGLQPLTWPKGAAT